MKTCHECQQPFAGHKGMRRCVSCHNAYFNIMELAHRAVGRAIRHGELPSLFLNDLPCVDCGKRARCYDHRDYNKPLEVDPVCRKCNYARGPAAPLGIAA